MSLMCSNAIKFCGAPQSSLPGKVWLNCSDVDEGKNIRISVTDNGIGMSDDIKQRLFSPFTQGESSTIRRFGGTGLGLSICKQRVTMMGGTIAVDTDATRGTTFEVVFPMQSSPALDLASGTTLKGVQCKYLVRDASLETILSAYLQNAGAQLVRFPDLETLFHQSHSVDASTVVIVALDSDDSTLLRWILKSADLPEALRSRLVVLRSRQHHQLSLPTGISVVLTDPMRRQSLVSAVEYAAGRQEKTPDAALTIAVQLHPLFSESNACRVLVAEDNPVNQEVIFQQLKRLGLSSTIVDNGCQAMALLQQQAFDLVLTDCHMPEMDGFQLTNAIRERESQHNLLRLLESA